MAEKAASGSLKPSLVKACPVANRSILRPPPMPEEIPADAGSNAVVVAKHHFWAEPLDTAVHKVLVRDLSARLPTFNITTGSGALADCTLLIDFDRLHASNTSRILVSGRYTLHGNARVEHSEFDVSLPLSDDDESTMVAVMRRALGNLSEEIVA